MHIFNFGSCQFDFEVNVAVLTLRLAIVRFRVRC